MILLLALLFSGLDAGHASSPAAPIGAMQALRSATGAELYSLEPSHAHAPTQGPTFHGYPVLGKALLSTDDARLAIAEFQAAMKAWDGMTVAMCFDPRHGLRVAVGGDTYDYVLCFECQAVIVYRNGVRLDKTGVAGSPDVLYALMERLGMALSPSRPQPPTPEAAAESAADAARWLAGMPDAARPLWQATNRFHFGAGLLDAELADLRTKLAADLPDPAMRIRALLRWFGSGEGPWTGYSSWESVPLQLLLEYDTAAIVAAVDLETPDPLQREGAARLFAASEFGRQRPDDRERLPAQLRQALSQHVLQTGDAGDEDRRRRARDAFGPATVPGAVTR